MALYRAVGAMVGVLRSKLGATRKASEASLVPPPLFIGTLAPAKASSYESAVVDCLIADLGELDNAMAKVAVDGKRDALMPRLAGGTMLSFPEPIE